MRRRGSIFGPLLLLSLGVLFLIRNFRPEIPVWELFGKYWPVLLIVLGLAKLIQTLTPAEPGLPPRPIFTAGEVFLVIFVCFFGWGIYKSGHIDFGNWDFFMESYKYSEEAQQAVFEKQPSISVINPRGEVRVTGTDGAEIQVKAEKEVRAGNESRAKDMNESAKLEISREGSQYIVRSNADRTRGRGTITINLEIRIPRGSTLDVQARRGDINVSDISGALGVSAERGDVTLTDIGGKVHIDLRRGSFTAQRIKGSIEMDGRGSDIQVTDVDGEVVIRGDYGGNIAFANVKQVLHLTTSRTEFQIQRLPGKVDMTIGSLNITEPGGPVSVTTRSKDIRIEDFDGPVQVTNRDASIDLSTKKLPVQNIEVENKSGRIDLTLPAAGHFQIDASARKGETNSDFAEVQSQRDNEQGTLKGTVGKSGSTIKLNTTYGVISLRKQG